TVCLARAQLVPEPGLEPEREPEPERDRPEQILRSGFLSVRSVALAWESDSTSAATAACAVASCERAESAACSACRSADEFVPPGTETVRVPAYPSVPVSGICETSERRSIRAVEVGEPLSKLELRGVALPAKGSAMISAAAARATAIAEPASR